MSRDAHHRSSAVGRRSRPVKSSSPISKRVAWCRSLLLASLVVVALAVMVDDSAEFLFFLLWYKTKFVDYYAPKLQSARKLLRGLGDFIPETVAIELQEAWDFSTAVIVVASVYHLIERLRSSALAKLQH